MPCDDRFMSDSGDAQPVLEVGALADGIISEITGSWPGLLARYSALTAGQVLQQAVADRLADARASVVSGMHKGGLSYAQIAAAAGLSRARAQQLAERGRKLS